MVIDAWLPLQFRTLGGEYLKVLIYQGTLWQIYETLSRSNVLIAKDELAKQWLDSGLLPRHLIEEFRVGDNSFFELSSPPDHILSPVTKCKSPHTKAEALSIASSYFFTRSLLPDTPIHDSIFVEKHSIFLPTYSQSRPIKDDIFLGTLLTGGIPISVKSSERFFSLMNWLSRDAIREVLDVTGIINSNCLDNCDQHSIQLDAINPKKKFSLVGRPKLESFFQEHVIDIIEKQDIYKEFGIEFPSAVILHGPPGCGKTFAIEKLTEYLGWPYYQIDASSVASPYIHETSKKVSDLFNEAMSNSPSLVIIDEMESFLADRGMGGSSGIHHVEEVAEFLRRIPEAIANKVLIFAMTNRLEMIDPAILRRGRFDHIVKVDMASEVEVYTLLTQLISALPNDSKINVQIIASQLRGRPLSDVTFVVREGCRLAAHSGKKQIDQESLMLSLDSLAESTDNTLRKKIGF